MAEATLKDLTARVAHIKVGDAEVEVRQIVLGQFAQMLELCAPLLEITIEKDAAFQADFEKEMVQIVTDEYERFLQVVVIASGKPLEALGAMTIDQLIHAIGVIVGLNPLFFSKLKRMRESRLTRLESLSD